MTEDKDLELGPFESLNYCPACNWTPVVWRNGGIATHAKAQKNACRRICPNCGELTEKRVGRQVFPKPKHVGLLRRLFTDPSPIKGWVRWKTPSTAPRRQELDANGNVHP